MMKSVSVVLFGAFCSLAMAQEPVVLGDSKAVDIHVTKVDWQPKGQALIYSREAENGTSLGVYSSGAFEGKVVISLKKGETSNINWLANSKSALVITRGEAPEEKVKSTQIKIYMVDAETQKAKLLFEQTYDDRVSPGIEVNSSPSLKHAILKFRSSLGTSHKVLCLGGASLVDSPDLDRAAKEGLSGPNWSVDGTAVYSNTQGPNIKTLTEIPVQVDDAISGLHGATAVSADVINVSEVRISDGSPLVITKRLLLTSVPPMPTTGTSVMELMTSNPILRPVRFRGPWVTTKVPGAPITPQGQSLTLRFDQSNAQDTSVWLTRGKEKGSPAALVAVHASQTWMPTSKNGIAYVIDGALFFRSIGN